MDSVKTISEIRERLQPVGAVYQGKPRLSREAAWSRLRNAKIAEVQAMCRQCNTNIEGLLDLLERRQIVLRPRPSKARKKDGGGVLFLKAA